MTQTRIIIRVCEDGEVEGVKGQIVNVFDVVVVVVVVVVVDGGDGGNAVMVMEVFITSAVLG